jgi:hypothetical protein
VAHISQSHPDGCPIFATASSSLRWFHFRGSENPNTLMQLRIRLSNENLSFERLPRIGFQMLNNVAPLWLWVAKSVQRFQNSSIRPSRSPPPQPMTAFAFLVVIPEGNLRLPLLRCSSQN